jgi:hypothetical protein
MLVMRFLVLIGLLSAAVSLALHIGTGDPRYKIIGWKILRWTLLSAFLFFTILILERVA